MLKLDTRECDMRMRDVFTLSFHSAISRSCSAGLVQLARHFADLLYLGVLLVLLVSEGASRCWTGRRSFLAAEFAAFAPGGAKLLSLPYILWLWVRLRFSSQHISVLACTLFVELLRSQMFPLHRVERACCHCCISRCWGCDFGFLHGICQIVLAPKYR